MGEICCNFSFSRADGLFELVIIQVDGLYRYWPFEVDWIFILDLYHFGLSGSFQILKGT